MCNLKFYSWLTIPLFALSGCGGEQQEQSSLSSSLSSGQSSYSSSSTSPLSSSSSSYEAPVTQYSGDICSDRITYSARKLRLLTRTEIQNSLEDLLYIDFDVRSDLPSDISIHGFENNLSTVVTELHADSYLAVAEKVAKWSRQNDFPGLAACTDTDLTGCAEQFTAQFLPRLYRRPLSDKERSRIAHLFSPTLTNGSAAEGLELSLVAALTSPSFLYRSEMGTPVSVGEYDGAQYEPINTGAATTTTAADFGRKDNGLIGDDGGWILRSINSQLSLIEQHFSLPVGGTLMTLEIRGEPRGGVYPELMIQVPNHTFVRTIDNEEYQNIQVYFPDTSGHHPVHIRLNNAPSQDGDGARLTIRKITFSEGALRPDAADDDSFRLTAHEIASFLAYTFTGSTPDDILLEAANSDSLDSSDALFQQAYRLLGTQRGKAHMGLFAEQWLGVNHLDTLAKDPAKYPELTAPIREAMAEEFRQFFAHIVSDPNTGFGDFFSANYTFANQLLADYYGIPFTAGDGFTKVSTQERGGVLTTGAFLATYGNPDETSPIRRAVSIRERLLCQSVPPPPPGIVIDRDAAEKEMGDAWINGEITNRSRYHSLTTADYCAACHKDMINPLGFGLEDFDTIGLKRDIDINGHMIDASGALIGIDSSSDGLALNFYGAKSLSSSLEQVHSTKSCVVQNAFRFVTGHGHQIIDELNPMLGELDSAELNDFACTINDLTAQLAETDDLKTLFASLGSLKLIRHRKEKSR